MNESFLEDLIIESGKLGWKNLRKNCSIKRDDSSEKFEVISERRFAFATKWFLLMDSVKYFDKEAYIEYQIKFNATNEFVKSWTYGQCFIYGILCDKIDEDLDKVFESSNFNSFRYLRIKGGGGNAFIVDKSLKKCHGKVPTIPLDAHIYSKQFKDMVERTF